MADHPDEVDHRVAPDRWAGLGPAQLPDAFLAERRDDSDKELAGPDALEISELMAARLPDVAHLKLEPHLVPLLDWPLLDAVLVARPVSALLLREQHLASPPLDALSDALLLQAARMRLLQVVLERRSVQRLRAPPSFPPERAREQPVPQALRAMVQLQDQPVSAQLRLEPPPGQGAQSSLWRPRSSRLPPQLPPQPNQGNVSALALHVRYQSSSSASFSL